jgi:hypothetical protein
MTDTPDILAGLVRPLEWGEPVIAKSFRNKTWLADADYHLSKEIDGTFTLWCGTYAKPVSHPTLEAAQAAANADHAARVLASIDADKLRALVDLLGKAFAMINQGFAAGVEEREGGSGRRQGKILDKIRAYETDVRAALAALQEPGPTAPRQE